LHDEPSTARSPRRQLACERVWARRDITEGLASELPTKGSNALIRLSLVALRFKQTPRRIEYHCGLSPNSETLARFAALKRSEKRKFFGFDRGRRATSLYPETLDDRHFGRAEKHAFSLRGLVFLVLVLGLLPCCAGRFALRGAVLGLSRTRARGLTLRANQGCCAFQRRCS
jgi:hypothetical protein